MRYVVGLLIFFVAGILNFSWLSPGGFSSYAFFIDIVTLVVFLLTICATVIISGEFGTLIKSKNALISKKYYLSNNDKERAITLYKVLAKVIVCTAVIMIVSTTIIMLGTLDDPAMLGPFMAVSLLSILYAAVLLLIFVYPAQIILKNRTNIGEKRVISEKEVINKLLELCYKNNISPEEILEADDISFKQQ